MKDIKELQNCPDCASGNVTFSEVREQIICRECGLIFEPLIPELEEKFETSHNLARPKSKLVKKLIKKPVKKAKKKR